MKIYLSFFLLLTTFILISFSGMAQPIGYYNGTEGKAGDDLKQTLHDKIRNHVDFSYNQAKYLINYSDADPNNPNNVILFYSQISRNASLYGTGTGFINREHVWAKSHGNFSGIRPMDGDALNLRPEDGQVNENRSNLDFGNVQPNGTNDPVATACWYNASAYEPGPLTKGQVARILFYMATRYDGTDGEIDLEMVSKLNNYPEPKFGNLTTLLEWNRQYPPSAIERQRNDRIFRMQQNRNPFVDHPEFADLIWAKGNPSGPVFGNFMMSPEFPSPADKITIAITIGNISDLTDVNIFWGNSFDSQPNQVKMEKSGDHYSADLSLSGYNAGDMIYFKVQTVDPDTQITEFRANYLLPESIPAEQLTSINNVQGTGSSSPLLNQVVTVSGRVTANFDNSYYLQTGKDKHSGINIFNTLFTGQTGDSLVVRGTVTEYSDLTEIGNVSYVYNFKSGKTPKPVVITASQVNEDYEGMLVQIDNVTFDKPGSVIQELNTSYTATDKTGSTVVFISKYSRLVKQSIPSKTINLVGIVSQFQGTYQILPRDLNDFMDYTPIVSLAQSEENKLVVYPNPANDILNIKSEKSIRSVKIINLQGRVVGLELQNTKQIPVHNLNNGIYFIEVTYDDKTTGMARFCK